MWPHLDYGDIIYQKHDPDVKLDFTKRLESTQYSAELPLSGAWRGTSFMPNLVKKVSNTGDGTVE